MKYGNSVISEEIIFLCRPIGAVSVISKRRKFAT